MVAGQMDGQIEGWMDSWDIQIPPVFYSRVAALLTNSNPNDHHMPSGVWFPASEGSDKDAVLY